MMNGNLQNIVDNIQDNCHIADALHAGNYTLCIYLLKMRELYRWESGRGFNSRIDNEALGNWLTEREALWDSLVDSAFKPVLIEQQEFDPMDGQGINQALLPQGLVYSAGIGGRAHPHFFLGKLEKVHHEGEYTIYVSHEELARDLTAPPAMAQGNHVFIRRESLRRMLWEKYEEWLWNKPDNAMKRAIQYYPFSEDVSQALDLMTNQELEMVLNHEIGEVKSSIILGKDWELILAELPRSRGEIVFRAVKDHLADSLSTLPLLLESFYPQSWHFYMANLTSMRKQIAPQLGLIYERWCQDSELQPLRDYVQKAQQHWLELARQMIALRANSVDIKTYSEAVHNLVEENYL